MAIPFAGIIGAGAGLATAQVNITPANPASFSSRVNLGIHNYELVIQNDSILLISLFGPISFTAAAIGGEGVI